MVTLVRGIEIICTQKELFSGSCLFYLNMYTPYSIFRCWTWDDLFSPAILYFVCCDHLMETGKLENCQFELFLFLLIVKGVKIMVLALSNCPVEPK